MKKFLYTLMLFLAFILTFSQSNKSTLKEVYISKIPKPTAPANLLVSEILFSDLSGNHNNLLDANEEAEIRFKIVNKGKGNAYNLVAKISDKTGTKGLTYRQNTNLGDLSTGKELICKLPINALENVENGKVEFEILITEGNNFDADAFRIQFNTQKMRNPSLAIVDHKFTSAEEGKIKLGVEVSLSVILQNEGQGDATGIKIDFATPNDVYPVNATTFTFDKLGPNESRKIDFEFFANKKYSSTVIPIEVTVHESKGRYGQSKTLNVSLDEYLGQTTLVNVNASFDKDIKIDKVTLTSDVDKNIPQNSRSSENTFALIIGNEDYSSFQPEISSEVNVAYATNDAHIFNQYCLNTLGLPKQNITLLTNATSAKMNQAIDKMGRLIEATNGKGKVIVYYAGHGLPDEKTKEPYLIPVDVSGSNVQAGIKLSYLYRKLTEFPAEKVVVFLDACFSGGGRDQSLLATRGVKIKPKDDLLTGKIVVCAASSGEQSALPWKEKQHGMFTYFLLKKLQESNGEATLQELSTYIKEKVSLESVRTNSRAQNPQVLMSEEMIGIWEKLNCN